MKGQKVNKLYKLIRNIVVGGTAITTPVEYNADAICPYW
jgi:hypothetical protein